MSKYSAMIYTVHSVAGSCAVQKYSAHMRNFRRRREYHGLMGGAGVQSPESKVEVRLVGGHKDRPPTGQGLV